MAASVRALRRSTGRRCRPRVAGRPRGRGQGRRAGGWSGRRRGAGRPWGAPGRLGGDGAWIYFLGWGWHPPNGRTHGSLPHGGLRPAAATRGHSPGRRGTPCLTVRSPTAGASSRTGGDVFHRGKSTRPESKTGAESPWSHRTVAGPGSARVHPHRRSAQAGRDRGGGVAARGLELRPGEEQGVGQVGAAQVGAPEVRARAGRPRRGRRPAGRRRSAPRRAGTRRAGRGRAGLARPGRPA